MALAHGPFPVLRVYQEGPHLAVQPPPTAGSGAELDTLSVDLITGSVTVTSKPPLRGTPTVEVVAILGLCKLYKGHALVAVTSVQRVAEIDGAVVYQASSTQVLSSHDALSVKENRGLLRLLKDATDPQGSGRSMYLSHFRDLTHSAQRLAAAGGAPLRPDATFMWNHAAAQPLVAAGAGRFVTPVILGFVRQVSGLSFRGQGGKEVKGSLTLIARRSVARAGTRQWRRGLDSEGNAANFVESEQIFELDGQQPSWLASFVQIRGSIPLLWTQLPNIKYKPTTVIGPQAESSPGFDRHMAKLTEAYKDVVALNLVNHKGSEGKLEEAFRAEAERYSKSKSGLRYLAFDFHKETHGKRYDRISLLWDKVSDDFAQHGFFLAKGGVAVSPEIAKKQCGVMRTNCIDCLDRTNVMQGILGRKAFEMVLRDAGLLGAGVSLPEAYPAVEQQFKVLWADHGDAVSTQYAGTGAMKSGFTRTGKRTWGGVVDDGVKAVTRYYLNNFQDGKKQDAVDLLTGAYVVGDRPPPIKPQPSPLLPIVVALAAIAFGVHRAGQVLGAPAAAAGGKAGQDEEAAVGAAAPSAGGAVALLRGAVLPVLFGVGLLMLLVQNGKHLVCKPQLCPQLANTVPRKKK